MHHVYQVVDRCVLCSQPCFAKSGPLRMSSGRRGRKLCCQERAQGTNLGKDAKQTLYQSEHAAPRPAGRYWPLDGYCLGCLAYSARSRSHEIALMATYVSPQRQKSRRNEYVYAEPHLPLLLKSHCTPGLSKRRRKSKKPGGVQHMITFTHAGVSLYNDINIYLIVIPGVLSISLPFQPWMSLMRPAFTRFWAQARGTNCAQGFVLPPLLIRLR